MNRQGKLLVVSGFSGAGKGTVMKKLLECHDNYCMSVSATTRRPREGEQDGREYFFKTVDAFQAMIAEGELLEYAQYVGNYYGTPKEYVVSKLEEGKHVILEIESVGALNVKKIYPEAVLVFVVPPSAKVLEERLVGRGTEDAATIARRLAKAASESAGVEQYDYIVVNDTVAACAETIHAIAGGDAEVCSRQQADRNLALIQRIREELKEYGKKDLQLS